MAETTFQHSKSRYGENMYMECRWGSGNDDKSTLERAVQSWASEVRD